MDTGTDSGPGLSISARSERACVIAALSGQLDITCGARPLKPAYAEPQRRKASQ
jgi:hypothetical protein